MKLFVGLGNPGAGYARHRHNVGFMAVDAIAAAHGFGPWRAKFRGQVAEGRLGPEKVLLLKPGTYMNLSGDAVRAALQFYKLEPADVVVFHDELDLAPGRVRVKTGGGTAGHNGIRSIGAHIGPDFTRVRLGIGHPGDKRLVTNHVLGDFAKADADWLDDLLAASPTAPPRSPPATAGLPERRRPPPAAAEARSREPRAPAAGAAAAGARGRPRPAAAAGGPLPVTARDAFRTRPRSAPPWAPLHRPALPPPRRPPRPRQRRSPTACSAGPATPRPRRRRCRCAWPAPCTASCSRPAPRLAAVYPPHEPRRRALAGRRRRPHRRGPLHPPSPGRPAADQRAAAQRRALPRLPDRGGADRPAARDLRARRQRRAQPLWDRFAYRFGAAAWGAPAAPVPSPRIGRARRRRCRPPASPSAPASTAPRPTRPRRGPAAAALLCLGRPDRAHGPHGRRDRHRPAPRHPRRARRRRRLARRPPRRRRARAARTSSITRSSGSISRPKPRPAPAALPRRRRRARATAAPLAWLRMEGDGADPGAAITLTLWPAARHRLLGRADYHGAWVRWTRLGGRADGRLIIRIPADRFAGCERWPRRRLPRHGLRLPGLAHLAVRPPRAGARVSDRRCVLHDGRVRLPGGQAGAGRACARPGMRAAGRYARRRSDQPDPVSAVLAEELLLARLAVPAGLAARPVLALAAARW